MQDSIIKIRRGKRSDLPALLMLLTPLVTQDHEKAQARYWRRLVSDPTHDCYVAEQAGSIQGVLLVSYIRSLSRYGWQAILDIAPPLSPTGEVGQELVNFAKARARRRGCQYLFVCTSEQTPLTPLSKAGFLRTGEWLSCSLS